MTNNSPDIDQNDKEIYGLQKAITTSWDILNNEPIESIINRTLCILGESSETILMTFLREEYIINLKKRTIITSSGKSLYNLFKMGIILHYLVHAKNKALMNKLISFRELWGGTEYYYAFNNRVLKPLIDFFSEKPDLLIKAGQSLGAEKVDKGEYGIRIPALPRMPVTVLLWTGDEEVEASANVLFDASANEHMETEGLVWLSIATVSELKKIK